MPPAKIVEVAAAVILRADGRFLLAQRPVGKVYAGFWEFPGGKAEPGEALQRALERELYEELGIVVTRTYPWIVEEYVYPHAHVRLHFFRVLGWTGEPRPREEQQLAWAAVDNLGVAPLLPANGPVLRALALPPVLAITNAGEFGPAPALDRVEAALVRGVRLVMVREKRMRPAQLVAFASETVSRCHRAGARVVINGDASLAKRCGADGVHLTSAALLSAGARPAVAVCGASCHNLAELAHAALLDLDYVVFGPVLPTPSHPDAPGIGWEGFAQSIRGFRLPVYALGGMQETDLTRAWEAGAHGIAVMRGL
jgi:8-oxo-dGTP diphosphatase